MIFKWKDNLNTGVEVIDNQHKRLFEIGNELYNLTILDDGIDHYDEIIIVIDKLKDYTKYHFDYEEQCMAKLNYIGLDEHKVQHQRFIDKLNEVEAKDIDMNQKQIILDIMDFILNWISGHIIGTDFKYRDLFLENI